jgi:hypothetical protein
MRPTIFPALVCLIALQGGCSSKDKTNSAEVSLVLPGNWDTDEKDRNLALTFADDGKVTMTFDQKPVEKDGSFHHVEPGKVAGTYRLTDSKTLRLDLPLTGKETPTMKLPESGSYTVSIVKENHKGIDKDRGGPHFKDWAEYRLTLTDAKGQKWELSRELR